MTAVHRGLLKLTLSIAALGAIAIAWLSQNRKTLTQNGIASASVIFHHDHERGPRRFFQALLGGGRPFRQTGFSSGGAAWVSNLHLRAGCDGLLRS